MPNLPAVSRLYASLLPRRFALGLILTGCLLAALFCLRNITLAENIDAMLPDDASRMAEDFRLLSHTPFLSKILVILEREPQTDPERLALAAQGIRAAAGPPWFKPQAEARQLAMPEAMEHLLVMLPALLDDNDFARIDAMLQPDAVRNALVDSHSALVGLQGLGLKKLIRSDPLQLRLLALDKLSSLDFFGHGFGAIAAGHGFFLSDDQDSALIVLDTPVAMTDAKAAGEMLDHLEKIISVQVTDGLRASVIGGHAYTVANAAAIRSDLVVVLAVSSLGILGLFLLFLRTWRPCWSTPFLWQRCSPAPWRPSPPVPLCLESPLASEPCSWDCPWTTACMFSMACEKVPLPAMLWPGWPDRFCSAG